MSALNTHRTSRTVALTFIAALLCLTACNGTVVHTPRRDDYVGGDAGPTGADPRDAGPRDPAASLDAGGAIDARDAGAIDTRDSGASTPTDPSVPVVPAPEGWRVVGYFTAWGVYARDYHVNEIPADQLTHINYAFANISPSGECELGDAYADTDKAYEGDTWEPGVLRGSFNALRRLKAAHPHLRTLISVGGWTWSQRFSDVALTAAARARFASSCADFMQRYEFDGIDVDWEYPVSGGLDTNTYRPEDRANYSLLLQAIRAELEARGAAAGGKHYLLTIAAPAGPNTIANLELDRIAGPLDWINLMAYDFHGGWESTTGHNAPLTASAGDATPTLNVTHAVDLYLDGGVPSSKLVLGVPFYGRGWRGVSAGARNGLFQPAGGVASGTWEDGVIDWHDLAANYIPRVTRHFDAEAQVPYLHDSATGLFISYDDADSLRAKVNMARTRGLGGAMLWELSADDAAHTLIDVLQ